MALFAQSGYGKGSKISSGIEKELIDGVILSPKGESIQSMTQSVDLLKKSEKQISILLDPQTYIMAFPEERAEGKLPTYAHYEPQIGASKLSNPKELQRVVTNALEMQRGFGLDIVVSPAVFFDSFNSRCSQIDISLAYESIEQLRDNEKLYVTLCFEEHALANRAAMEEYLDILCNLDVEGFYIIVDREHHSFGTAYFEAERLANLMYLCYVLGDLNQYRVVVGYCDFAGIPLYAAGASAIATGWFGNQKHFHRSDYEVRAGGRRARKRFSSELLLNSMLLSPELAGIEESKRGELVYGSSEYAALLKALPDDSRWTEEAACLQNWAAIKNRLNMIDQEIEIHGRMKIMIDIISIANTSYESIDYEVWETRSKDKHLESWSRAVAALSKEIR